MKKALFIILTLVTFVAVSGCKTTTLNLGGNQVSTVAAKMTARTAGCTMAKRNANFKVIAEGYCQMLLAQSVDEVFREKLAEGIQNMLNNYSGDQLMMMNLMDLLDLFGMNYTDPVALVNTKITKLDFLNIDVGNAKVIIRVFMEGLSIC